MRSLLQIWSFVTGLGGIGMGVTAGAIALAVLVPTVRRLAIQVAVIAGVGTALYGLGHHRGYSGAMDDVESQNKGAANAAREAVGNVRACRDGGGVWNQTTGECDGGV